MVKNASEHLYTYDNANRVTQEDISDPSTMPITVQGTVSDANGIQSIKVNNIDATLEGTTFSCPVNLVPNANTLTVTATDAAGNTATETLHLTYDPTEEIVYQYDNNGNLISKQSSAGTITLGYDYENRLNSVSGGGVSLDFGYDGEGRRVTVNNGSILTNYLYDGMDTVLETRGTNDPVVSYLRNPHAAGGIGGIISRNTTTGETTVPVYYSYDGLGSVAGTTDASAAVLQTCAYDAFGNLLTAPDPANNRQFLTKEEDPSGLIYFGARYYDPSIGRFITQDPSGMVDGPNMYLYVGNSPLEYVDLWGLCKEKSWFESLWEWYLLESNLPGPYGLPVSKWEAYGTTSYGDFMLKQLQSHQTLFSQEQIAAMVIGFSGGIGPVGKVPSGFAKTIQQQATKSLGKAIKSLTNRISEHLEKIASNPNSRYITHWRKEIEAFKQQIEWIIKELNSRQ
jgi:RHS repeat-associated protein